MAKSYGRKPTTAEGKRISIAHLQMTDRLVMKKIKDHDMQASKGIDMPYNQSHSKEHKKEHKAIQKYMKKIKKMKVKAAKK